MARFTTRSWRMGANAKVQRHVQAPLEQYENPPHRFATINIDIVGPLPISQGFSYLFTIVDRFTRWPEAIPMTDATATSWISRFGIPQSITSDRGPQFTSQIWNELSQTLGFQLNLTTAYHPQAN